VLARTRQDIPSDRAAGAADPDVVAEPVWMVRAADGDGGAGS
jgi:hypothetical protein